jgi:Trp operon repressor
MYPAQCHQQQVDLLYDLLQIALTVDEKAAIFERFPYCTPL